MLNSLDTFKQQKELLTEAAGIINALAQRRNDLSLSSRIGAFCTKIDNTTFNLAVVGEFKRGKSTLVNALIGDNILPMAVIPLTSIATIIRYGVDKIEVKFQNNQTVEITKDKLVDYVTESGNPNNHKLVSTVEIQHSAALLRDGVRLIDTPGVGSAFKHNTTTTYDYLPEIDAAIFLFSADQPASQLELAFLKDVNEYAPRTFLVQNKIDHLSHDELAESLTFLKKTIAEQMGSQPVLYPISAKAALNRRLNKTIEADGFDLLEHEILDFLVNGKAQTLIASSSARLKKEIASTRQLLQLEQHSRKQPLEALRESIVAFSAAADKIRQEQSDAEYIINGETANLVRTIESDLNKFVAEHRSALVAEIDTAFMSNRNLDKAALIQTLRQHLLQQTKNIFDQWRLVEEAVVAESFSKITARFAERANSIVAQISKATKEHLGVDATAHFELEPLTSDSRHRYVVDDPFTLAVESLPLLLPAILAKPIIRGRFLSAASSELSRNSGRLRADFQERITKTTKDFLNKFRAQVNISLEEIKITAERALVRESQGLKDGLSADEQLAADLLDLERAELLLHQSARNLGISAAPSVE
jgi:GTP-binding protein EngB required for normal cell division/phenylpyruvate tautomerase PptA (4-oxalocrotonate tautomerase family)